MKNAKRRRGSLEYVAPYSPTFLHERPILDAVLDARAQKLKKKRHEGKKKERKRQQNQMSKRMKNAVRTPLS